MTGVGIGESQNQQVQQQSPAGGSKVPSPVSVRINKLLYFILGLVEVLLGFRFVFKLLGANPLSGFVALLYSMTDTLLAPFSGIFGVSAARTSVIEWSIFVAMVVYWVLAIGVMQLVNILFATEREE